MALTMSSRHLKIHSKPFRCFNCPKGFRYRKDLQRHRNSKHYEESRDSILYACPIVDCNFTTTRKDNCRRHLLNQHEVAATIQLQPHALGSEYRA